MGKSLSVGRIEKNGSRFHWFIDRYFKEAPFLRLNLELLSRYLLFYFNIKFRDDFRIYIPVIFKKTSLSNDSMNAMLGIPFPYLLRCV